MNIKIKEEKEMNWLNMIRNSSYNFFAPNIEGDSNKKVEVVFPTFEKKTPTFAATQEVLVERQTTIVDLGELTGACKVDLTISEDVQMGATLAIMAKSDTTARDVTCGTGFFGGAIAGTISKTKVQHFVYNGTAFMPVAAAIQLD